MYICVYIIPFSPDTVSLLMKILQSWIPNYWACCKYWIAFVLISNRNFFFAFDNIYCFALFPTLYWFLCLPLKAHLWPKNGLDVDYFMLYYLYPLKSINFVLLGKWIQIMYWKGFSIHIAKSFPNFGTKRNFVCCQINRKRVSTIKFSSDYPSSEKISPCVRRFFLPKFNVGQLDVLQLLA